MAEALPRYEEWPVSEEHYPWIAMAWSGKHKEEKITDHKTRWPHPL